MTRPTTYVVPRWLIWAVLLTGAALAWFGCAPSLSAQGLSAAAVREFGDCPDVSAPVCPVRDFWPRSLRTEAVGQSVYWLRATDGRVCFVDQRRYGEAIAGRASTCVWRYRQP